MLSGVLIGVCVSVERWNKIFFFFFLTLSELARSLVCLIIIFGIFHGRWCVVVVCLVLGVKWVVLATVLSVSLCLLCLAAGH